MDADKPWGSLDVTSLLTCFLSYMVSSGDWQETARHLPEQQEQPQPTGLLPQIWTSVLPLLTSSLMNNRQMHNCAMASLAVSLHGQGGRQSPDLLQHINTQTCSRYVDDTWVKGKKWNLS